MRACLWNSNRKFPEFLLRHGIQNDGGNLNLKVHISIVFKYLQSAFMLFHAFTLFSEIDDFKYCFTVQKGNIHFYEEGTKSNLNILLRFTVFFYQSKASRFVVWLSLQTIHLHARSYCSHRHPCCL